MTLQMNLLIGGIISYFITMIMFLIVFIKTNKLQNKTNVDNLENVEKLINYSKQAKVEIVISAIMFCLNYIIMQPVLLILSIIIVFYIIYQAAIRLELVSIYLHDSGNYENFKFAKRIINQIILICILIGITNILKFIYAWI